MAPIKRSSFSCKDPTVLALAEQQLASSGLTFEDAALLGMDVLDEDYMSALGYQYGQPAILFKYWDPFINDYTPLSTFHRVRLLGTPKGFSSQTTKPLRYLQPKGTLNQLYLPRCVKGEQFDWLGFMRGGEALVITEGEKKAAIACKMGITCLALGGVDMWRAQGRGVDELPALSKTNFASRDVYVVFDTDTATGLKVDVMASANRLMEHLIKRGAAPSLAVLPPEGDGEKVALDDYLQKHTTKEFLDLINKHSVPYASSRKLCDLAERFAYVINVTRFFPLSAKDGGRDNPMTSESINNALGKEKLGVPVLTSVRVPGGQAILRPVMTPVPISEALLSFGGLAKCKGATYSPGETRLAPANGGGVNFNLWEGWACEYTDDSHKLPSKEKRAEALGLWEWVLDNLFADEPIAREFVEHWLLYPIKHPGAKMNTMVMLTSTQQGIGKSFIGEMLAKFVYGLLSSDGPKHASMITEGRLDEAFNSYLYATSFVCADDIAAQHKVSTYKRIMSWITSQTVEINIKNVPQFEIDNKANFWLTSNDQVPFFFADNDRRAMVHKPRRAIKNPDKFNRLKQLFVEGIAGPALLYHAREEYFEGMFLPTEEAPWTTAKKEVIQGGKGQLRDWLEGLIAHAKAEELSRPYATVREMLTMLELDDSRLADKANDRGIGLMLSDCGALYYAGGAQVLIKNHNNGTSRRERIWVLGDPVEVLHMSKEQMSDMMSNIPFKQVSKDVPGNVVRMKKPKF